MPPSKHVRARHNPLREKILVAPCHQRRLQRRRRVVGTISTVIILGILTTIALAVANAQSSKVAVAPPTSGAPVTTTTVPLPSAKGKPCVALRDTLPKGAPAVPISVGPPAAKLVVKDLKVGTGAVVAKTAQHVTVDYVGVSCSSGKIFDASFGRHAAIDADLSGTDQSRGVIPGWTKGIPGMKVGGIRLLEIPPADAYGSRGAPGLIAPDETLFFLVRVNKVS